MVEFYRYRYIKTMVAHLPMVIHAVCYAEYDKNLLRPCWLQTFRNIKKTVLTVFIQCFILFLKIKRLCVGHSLNMLSNF